MEARRDVAVLVGSLRREFLTSFAAAVERWIYLHAAR